MSIKRDAWGVEVGAQAIKAMKLGRSANGVELLDFDVMPFKHVLTTPDLNVEEAIRVNLEALAQKHEFDKSQVVVSVPGHMAFARFAKLPPIEASKVKSIVAYEAQQQIPFPISEVEWDYQVFAQDDAPDIEVGIFAITKERVANFLSNYRAVGLRVDTLTLSPVAVYNAFAFENDGGSGQGDNTVYLDIGTTSTDIIVVESGGIWLRTLPLGGNHFTNALMKQFKISFAKAEKLKLEAGTSKYAKQIFQAMRGVFSDLVTEIQRSLGFYMSLNRDSELTQIVGVGSTWKLPGLQKYLKQNLQMKVVRPDGFSQLEVEDRRAAEFSSIAVNMATAYGLALQGLGMSAVDANILPQSVLQQRMWKAKQPWIGAAAACVVGAAIIAPVTQFMAGSSFNTAWGESENTVKATIAQATTLKGEYDNVQTNDPRPGIRNIRRAFDYTNLTTGLMEDVAAAMATIEPHPDLKQVDWDKPEDIQRVAAVKRPNRSVIWVTTIDSQYLPPAAVQDSGTSGAPEDNSFGDGGGGEFPGDPGFAADQPSFEVQAVDVALIPQIPYPPIDRAASSESEQPSNDGSGSVAANSAADPSPRIIVTVRGASTMERAELSRVLQQKFLGWMKNNAERPGRPYLLPGTFSSPPTFAKRGTTSVGADAGSELTRTPTPKAPEAGPGVGSPLGGPGLGGPGLGAPGLGGPGLGGPGIDAPRSGATNIEVKTPEGWYAKLGSSSAGFSINALMPRRPLSTEERSNDMIFTFQFEVILLSPDEARKSILPKKSAPAESEEVPAAQGLIIKEDQA